MSSVMIVLLILSCFSLMLATHYVDARYGLQLGKWLNGETNSPFNADTFAKPEQQYLQQIAELKQRVEVLEKLVTEPAYELNQKLNRL